MKEIKVTILDGYLDEPSCLGVPPYIAPHVRYTYGALKDVGLTSDQINYLTIDQLRADQESKLAKLDESDLVVMIAGTTVPGKYLGGQPISIQEIEELANQLVTTEVILSGPIVNCGLEVKFIDQMAAELPGLTVYQRLNGDKAVTNNPAQLVNRWAKLGAEVTQKHPNFPYLVCEVETFRGCPRQSNCSFCSEGLKQITYHRSIGGIIDEVEALAKLGNQYLRLGCQTDILLFQGQRHSNGRLIPRVDSLKQLYAGISRVAPNLKTLHLDNINPATIADFPQRSREILEIIAKHNTSGDIAAFGLESADPQVLKANNIGTTPEKTLEAIRIMNQVSGYREQGVPKLLPGINLLHGLKGERAKTMELNFNFLKRVLEEGLLVRRINIRQVNEIQDYQSDYNYSSQEFKDYKAKINEEINQPMLERVFPQGTLLEEVIIEEVNGKTAFGRQLGTYPILVGVPGDYEVGEIVDVKVVDHGYRSVTGIVWPFKINNASLAELEALPGIGNKRAMRLFMSSQIESLDHLDQILDYSYDVEQLEELVVFD
ncbi:MAG: radical SAM protein [Bacillota bacterium]